MSKRLFISLLFILSLGLNGVVAAAGELNAKEIDKLLSDNTVVGDWGGKYKQYYATDGFTIYLPSGGSGAEGKWRVNTETNHYESWWAETGWTPYGIAHDGDNYAWIDAKGDRYAFTVEKGFQFK
jgi:hypothetical protein